jgi:branched-chain amino acid transport system permease protein
MQSTLHHRARPVPATVCLLLLAALPLFTGALGQEFYVTFAIRILIFALAATSLNLVLGFGGMVALGHASFFGLGAYAVGILMSHGISSAWIAWPLATLVGGVAALLVGLVSLRTSGVYFIMITLSFAQMLYYLFVSLTDYGGDDGMSLPGRSTTGFGLDLAGDTALYYVVLAIFAAVMAGLQRLVNARFGRVLQAIRENETRMQAIGYPVLRYKLASFALSGALAALAGALIANLNGFISPSLMFWTQSGALMIMVILGGVGYLYGGVIGALCLLLLEETLSNATIYWQLPLGLILLLVVLCAPRGVAGLLRKESRHG